MSTMNTHQECDAVSGISDVTLRKKAEAVDAEICERSSEYLLPLTLEEAHAVLKELRLHKIELDLQNKELQRSQAALHAMHEQYVDLYEMAPVGYCSVGEGGLIFRANQTMANMLGWSVEALHQYAFGKLIFPADRDTVYLLRKQLTNSGDTRAIELRMLKLDGIEFWVQLVARVVHPAGGDKVLRIALHDITDRKLMEMALQTNDTLLKSDAFNRSVIDSIPARVAVLDRSGCIVAVNMSWQDAAQRNSKEIGVAATGTGAGANYLSVCRAHVEAEKDPYAQKALSGIESVLAGRQSEYSMDYPCCTEWFLMNVVPLGTDIQGVVVSHTNISARKRVDLALAESESRFSSFMDTLPAVAFIKNGDGELVYANQYYEQTINLGDWRGKTSADIYPPELAERLDIADRNALATGYLVTEEVFPHADGSFATYQDHKFAIQQPDSSPLLGCIALDITEHKQIEVAYRESQEHLSQAQRIANIGSWRLDLVNGELRWSDELFRMLGYMQGEIPPTDEAFTQRILPEDRADVVAAIAESVAVAGPHHIEYRIQLPDGSQRIMQSEGMVEVGHLGQPVLITGTVLDITDRKRIENELFAAKLAAERANIAKSRFLAAASHDLRQPLAAMALYVGVMEVKVDPAIQPLVKKISSCCSGLSELLNDLLDVSKLEAGVVVPRLVDISIDDFVNNLLSLHAPEAQRKGLSLRWRNCQAYTKTDPVLIQRVLGNVLSNAIRYTSHGGVLIAYRRRNGRTWLEVWDTGIGIAADKLDIIFEEFSQLSTLSSSIGSGLGLAIMAKMANLLDLKVRVHSRPGRGSMFAVELPQGRANDALQPVSPEAQNRTLRIAVVEDNAQVLDALVGALQEAGHEVVAAHEGQSLLQQLGDTTPDIIIADYRLSHNQTGFDAINAARATFGEDLPALIMTGDTDPTLIRDMSRRGIAIQYKPLQMHELLACTMQEVKRRR